MRQELQKLFDDAFENFQNSDCTNEDFHHGQMTAYDECLKLLTKQEKEIREETKKFTQGFSYKPPA